MGRKSSVSLLPSFSLFFLSLTTSFFELWPWTTVKSLSGRRGSHKNAHITVCDRICPLLSWIAHETANAHHHESACRQLLCPQHGKDMLMHVGPFALVCSTFITGGHSPAIARLCARCVQAKSSLKPWPCAPRAEHMCGIVLVWNILFVRLSTWAALPRPVNFRRRPMNTNWR